MIPRVPPAGSTPALSVSAIAFTVIAVSRISYPGNTLENVELSLGPPTSTTPFPPLLPRYSAPIGYEKANSPADNPDVGKVASLDFLIIILLFRTDASGILESSSVNQS